MHTARQLSADMFDIEIAGRKASIWDLLPSWTSSSRLGVVVREPLGGLGASLLIQAATVAFYEANPSRRERPLYPEIFVFHVGGPFGSFAPLDIWPPRKEVFVGGSSQDLLAAVNNCAVTHLAAPEGPVEAVEHRYKEPDAAMDRLRGGLLYSANGRVARPDIHITGRDGAGVTDVATVIRPNDLMAAVEAGASSDPGTAREKQRFVWALRDRHDEVTEAERLRAGARREGLIRPGGAVLETYRALSIADALARL